MRDSLTKRKVLLVIMDGVGVRKEDFGNAVNLARRPNLQQLEKMSLYRTLYAHGTYVGMPSDADLGNSEVGHNAMGAGRIFDQGAKLVKRAIESQQVYQGETWKQIVSLVKGKPQQTLHLIGLLSDGNVHAHDEHLYSLMRKAKLDGLRRVRVHVLLDGRDVGQKTAEVYIARLNAVIKDLRSVDFDVAVASGGGRMVVTMDRYDADWQIVERGWHAHVLGSAPHKFKSLDEAIIFFRKENFTDQYIPPFVIEDERGPCGPVLDHDAVVFFNFRGDRAIEISRAFCEPNFKEFDRVRWPQVYYAGMMEYDGDLKIPHNYLVAPPAIDETLGAYLADAKVRQFACSETQKFGHMTFFWNGNRSGKFDEETETYVEVPSDRIEFDRKPAMKAKEITDVTIAYLQQSAFDFGRINLPNGDMVGHTGKLAAAISAVESVDEQIGRLVVACEQSATILVVTADHGNCEEMFDAKTSDFPNWSVLDQEQPKPKTSHTLNPVPFYVFVPRSVPAAFRLKDGLEQAGLANIANTMLTLMGIKTRDIYMPSVVSET